MKFFYGCTDEKEAKAIYHKLAKCFHPDKGGSNELMIELKKQYDNWDEPVTAQYNSHFTPSNFNIYHRERFSRDDMKIQLLQQQRDSYYKQVVSLNETINAIMTEKNELKMKLEESHRYNVAMQESIARDYGLVDKYKDEIARLSKLKEPKGLWSTIMNKIGNLTE